MGQVTIWTPPRVELLRRLWAQGLGAGECARRMGMTRGAVAAKRAELRLPPLSREAQYVAMAANGRRTAAMCGHYGKASRAEDRQRRKDARAAAASRLMQPLAGSNPAPWQLRGPGQCSFPVGGWGAEALSCCEPVEPGRFYCFGHTEILAGRPWPPIEPANLGPSALPRPALAACRAPHRS